MKREEETLKLLYDIIPIGKENAISVKALSNYFAISPRDVRALILNARQNGFMICSLASDCGGYYRPTELIDVIKCYKIFQQRAKTTDSVLLGMREYLIHNGINPDTAKDERSL